MVLPDIGSWNCLIRSHQYMDTNATIEEDEHKDY